MAAELFVTETREIFWRQRGEKRLQFDLEPQSDESLVLQTLSREGIISYLTQDVTEGRVLGTEILGQLNEKINVFDISRKTSMK